MAEHLIDDPLFDYKVYRFGRSRQIFRGPQPDLRGRFLCFIGASHTFGRFTYDPFPTLMGARLGMTALNLGTDGAGPGFFLNDPDILHVASSAEVCIVQAMCASAISNRMFTVRPRRNIRVHAVSDLLIGLYPEVEFARFAFVKPMLRHLRALDETRFKLVENEMKNAWIGRTQTLLSAVETRTILLWFSQRSPEDADFGEEDNSGADYPAFVDRAMIDTVKPAADAYVECTTSRGLPQDLCVDGRAVLYRPSGEPIGENREFPSPQMHEAAAEALLPETERLLKRWR